MRKFKIINSLGAEFDLMRKDGFFSSPDGLGRSRTQSYEQIGDFLFGTYNQYKSGNITGEMVFKSYTTYAEFASFIEHEPLVLCYSPLGNDTWYFRDCVCTRLSKSEFSKDSAFLIANIDLLPLTLWYDRVKVYKNELVVSGNTATFPFTFPATFSDIDKGSVTIKNTRPREAPCKITFYGPITNPSWTLLQNGSAISSGAVNAVAGENERIVVDANPGTMEVSLYNASNERTDIYQDIDFEHETFIYAPMGNSLLSVQHEGTAEINVMVEVRQYADAV